MPQHYLIFYKPYGVLSQFSPEPGASHPTLKEFIPIPDVYPVGRLDHDSEGLLLLTDDGRLQHFLSDPRYGHRRTYWVQVEGQPTAAQLQQLRQGGLKIQNYFTRPALVHHLPVSPDLPERDPPIRHRAKIPTAWLELTLREGRNRQVRRMTAAVGLPTLRLIRCQIENLSIAGLTPGQWRPLTKAECQQIRPKGR
ncbi:pseudouridine synthase [Thermosynechococcaceae cyanobacterium BACA0444]|uniref:Pseudouridine synthase n=1 Tax=Pseudocalidococcus azoricus BACA0444 TaxID=2918990 RepID=A0AAE4FTG4_9CYAN|nr:pseudouridine synthase [Pseudocalidococcus azoricus]MDS3860635.1 pseudouridine synthase [Pseudocalidococcus azoricus BACA0444]